VNAFFLYNLACHSLRTLHMVRGAIPDDNGSAALVDEMIHYATEEVTRLTPPRGVLHRTPTCEMPEVPMGVCIFCREQRTDVDGKPCASFQGSHEFRGAPPAPVQTKRLDLGICTKCKMHKKNPASATNGCEHTYPQYV